jgi:hypothetical protein
MASVCKQDWQVFAGLLRFPMLLMSAFQAIRKKGGVKKSGHNRTLIIAIDFN